MGQPTADPVFSGIDYEGTSLPDGKYYFTEAQATVKGGTGKDTCLYRDLNGKTWVFLNASSPLKPYISSDVYNEWVDTGNETGIHNGYYTCVPNNENPANSNHCPLIAN